MERRAFFHTTSLAFGGTALSSQHLLPVAGDLSKGLKKTSRNIIFMVSDRMSSETLSMADLLLQRKDGKHSHWFVLYGSQMISRALMDTPSASSLVTGSAARILDWSGGMRFPNGSLNINADHSTNIPIPQKSKAPGKSVSCVTKLPVAHTTPAGFCVNRITRSDMDTRTDGYLLLRFDVMMGGEQSNFSAAKRQDKKDLLVIFRQKDYLLLSRRDKLSTTDFADTKSVIGIFADEAPPYSLDRAADKALSDKMPSIAEMVHAAIQKMQMNQHDFVLLVKGGKVDWATHADDVGALLCDQIAFDEAVGVAIDFAEMDGETLVIITNASLGLFYGDDANRKFYNIQKFRLTNDRMLKGIDKGFNPQVIERIEYVPEWVANKEQACELLGHYARLDGTGVYNPCKLHFEYLSDLQLDHTSVAWAAIDQSGDYVDLAAYGPGSQLLKPFAKRTNLQRLMLDATLTTVKN